MLSLPLRERAGVRGAFCADATLPQTLSNVPQNH